MKPNGGASMKDQVNRMEKDICELKEQNKKGEEYHEKLDNKIDDLTKMFVEYVSRQN
jgi:peptidoglycan hydrolase CwlO-like protein